MSVNDWKPYAERLVNVLFPERCLSCGLLHPTTWCFTCREDLKELEEPLCEVCGMAEAGPLCVDCQRTVRGFQWARSRYHHQGSVRRMILRFKYADCRRLAAPLAECLEPLLRRAVGDGATVIVPIPADPLRAWRRGFNPPGLIAAEAGTMMGLPVITSALGRRWGGRPQARLHGNERKANVAGRYFIRDGSGLVGQHVILIDDVMTTGATCSAAAAVLRQAGAGAVYAVTVARGG